ncbi:MAG TPA: TMEM165/GDT1 family protein [Streptosporangiaceae bacterium]|nr:TMEM165/GDT1 family protein [Streptosporangiaceae bacterium]
MSLAVCAVAFTLVLPAELPDKTAFASLVLGTRHRPLPVFAGVAAAFAVHTCLAVLAGGLLSLLPHRALDAVVAALFLFTAWLLWRRRGQDEEPAPDRAVKQGFLPVAATSFAIVIVAEFGDLTQLVIANLAARYDDPLSVGIGSLLALWVVAALAVTGGRGLQRVLPFRLISTLGAAAMVVMAALSVIGALAG